MTVILQVTVLCHEFGHGNMARHLGGEIAFVLLWIFGGICFSSRSSRVIDAEKILRNDLLVVVAGPSTHFLQTPLWGLVLWLMYAIFSALYDEHTGYTSAWAAMTAAMNPIRGFDYALVMQNVGMWSALLWSLVGWAIQLNVVLFLFNVFFPMYPADGSKLLVCSLMFICRVPARRAALILISVSVPCALFLMGYAMYFLFMQIRHGIQSQATLSIFMGWMGVMSLSEAYKIWTLRKARRLHEHPLFHTARSWQTQQRDEFGVVHRLNVSDFDDEAPMRRVSLCGVCFGGSSGGSEDRRGILACMLPCFFGSRVDATDTAAGQIASRTADPAQSGELRGQRQAMLDRIENAQGR
jgi:hypothetical protein